MARGWADNCRFEHNAGRCSLGENLYATTSSEDTRHDEVGAWAAEAADDDYAGNRCVAGQVCGHYTHPTWHETRQVGCARAQCTRNSPFRVSTWYLWVCNYARRGTSWVSGPTDRRQAAWGPGQGLP